MYQKILVPLDGSKLAECVLPHVENIAINCSVQQVILVSVTERVKVTRPVRDRSMPLEWHLIDGAGSGQVADPKIPLEQPQLTGAIGKKQSQAQRYLDRIAKRLRKKGLDIRMDVLLGNPAEEIASFSEGKGIDLIVMASHGRSGISRWAYGSVAEKIFRATCIPILMVRVPGCVPGI